MKRLLVGVVAVVTLVGGAIGISATMASGESTKQPPGQVEKAPPVPGWVRANGTIDCDKKPKKTHLADSQGRSTSQVVDTPCEAPPGP